MRRTLAKILVGLAQKLDHGYVGEVSVLLAPLYRPLIEKRVPNP